MARRGALRTHFVGILARLDGALDGPVPRFLLSGAHNRPIAARAAVACHDPLGGLLRLDDQPPNMRGFRIAHLTDPRHVDW